MVDISHNKNYSYYSSSTPIERWINYAKENEMGTNCHSFNNIVLAYNNGYNNPINDLESLELDDKQNIISIGKKVKTLNEIEGQYIGLMKFQHDAIQKIKSFYSVCKETYHTTHSNPLNCRLTFENSYMTDFLQGLIDSGNELKSIPIENGWLELDTIDDYKLYTDENLNKKITEFYNPND